jgi:hypothetical protein
LQDFVKKNFLKKRGEGREESSGVKRWKLKTNRLPPGNPERNSFFPANQGGPRGTGLRVEFCPIFFAL